MTGEIQTLPVRIYEAGVKIMIAAPMPGLTPDDIAVVPHQHGIRLAAAEWTVGPYDRELRLSRPVNGASPYPTVSPRERVEVERGP